MRKKIIKRKIIKKKSKQHLFGLKVTMLCKEKDVLKVKTALNNAFLESLKLDNKAVSIRGGWNKIY